MTWVWANQATLLGPTKLETASDRDVHIGRATQKRLFKCFSKCTQLLTRAWDSDNFVIS